MQKPKNIYSVTEVAAILKKSPRQVERYIKDGKLRARTIGRTHIIDNRQLKAFQNKSTLTDE